METDSMAAEIVGKPYSDVQQQLGDPTSEETFELGLAVQEFRIELTNLFDESVRAENPPTIREATWAISSDQNLTVWFSQSDDESWSAVHTLSWHPGDQF